MGSDKDANTLSNLSRLEACDAEGEDEDEDEDEFLLRIAKS